MSEYSKRLEKNKPETFTALALIFPSRYIEIIDIISKEALLAKQAEVDILKAELRLWKPKPTTQEERNSAGYKIIKTAIKAKLKEKRLSVKAKTVKK